MKFHDRFKERLIPDVYVSFDFFWLAKGESMAALNLVPLATVLLGLIVLISCNDIDEDLSFAE